MPPIAEITELIVFVLLASAVVIGSLGVVLLPNLVSVSSPQLQLPTKKRVEITVCRGALTQNKQTTN